MISQQSFGYDATYPDRLTNCGGTSISYNAMGCPTTVNGYAATWTRGKLSKLTKGSIRTGTETYNYTYNAFGQRIGINYNYMAGTSSSSAIVMGMLTSYSHKFCYDQSGRLISESKTSQYYGEGSGTEKKVYLYDESGIIGMVYTSETGASTTYYFQRNLLGDVIGIYNTRGEKVGGYAYDAWGNCTITLNSDGSAIRNPIRYRGYYYDQDTKLYFLNARYYSPEWRRFISPDDTAYLDSKNVNGLNLYAYCNNDPVNYADPSGHFTLPNWAKWLIGGVAFAGAVALTAITGGALAPVLIGMGVSIASSALIEGAISAYNGEGFWSGFANGAADGAMWGGIFALGGASLRTIKMFKNGVAIGENMTRVKNLATVGNQITYKPMPGYKLISSIWGEEVARNLSMQHNRRFIERMMKMGVTIVDFGIDVSRPNRSFYYLMETLFTTGYDFLKIMY